VPPSNLKTRIRRGDTVVVTAGREKGKRGKVLKILKDEGRLLVEKVNIIKRHTKPSQKNQQGGIIEREGRLFLSNVMLVCSHCGKATRIGLKIIEQGQKLRQCKKCGEILDKS
jgi:large subunit ribosomal protein L24